MTNSCPREGGLWVFYFVLLWVMFSFDSSVNFSIMRKIIFLLQIFLVVFLFAICCFIFYILFAIFITKIEIRTRMINSS